MHSLCLCVITVKECFCMYSRPASQHGTLLLSVHQEVKTLSRYDCSNVVINFQHQYVSNSIMMLCCLQRYRTELTKFDTIFELVHEVRC